jgi:hypothetical protein
VGDSLGKNLHSGSYNPQLYDAACVVYRYPLTTQELDQSLSSYSSSALPSGFLPTRYFQLQYNFHRLLCILSLAVLNLLMELHCAKNSASLLAPGMSRLVTKDMVVYLALTFGDVEMLNLVLTAHSATCFENS